MPTLYKKITFQQYLISCVDIIHRLLFYLPFCENSTQRDGIILEIRRLRREVVEIEEMTKTEKQKPIKVKIITIESDIN